MILILYAFTMSQHRAIYGAKVDTLDKLLRRLETAVKKGAEVISIRIYR